MKTLPSTTMEKLKYNIKIRQFKDLKVKVFKRV